MKRPALEYIGTGRIGDYRPTWETCTVGLFDAVLALPHIRHFYLREHGPYRSCLLCGAMRPGRCQDI